MINDSNVFNSDVKLVSKNDWSKDIKNDYPFLFNKNLYGVFSFDDAQEIYHGSAEVIIKPKIIHGKYTKDFGNGFYLTLVREQAEVWATNRNNGTGFVSCFSLSKLEALDELNIKVFNDVSDEWVNFIVSCRRGVPHNYDIVEGPMGDDKIFNSVVSYLRGEIPFDKLKSDCIFNKPNHQICFCSNKALEFLDFQGCYKVKLKR